MSTLKIYTKATEKTFKYAKENEMLVGEIYLQLDDVYYPYKGWSDFTVSVLDLWMTHCIYLSQLVVEVDARFFEGPYGIAIRRERDQAISESVLTFRCYRSDEPDPNFPNIYEVFYRDYSEALINAASDFLTQLENGGVTGKNNKEVRRLEEQLHKQVQFFQENMVEDEEGELGEEEELTRLSS